MQRFGEPAFWGLGGNCGSDHPRCHRRYVFDFLRCRRDLLAVEIKAPLRRAPYCHDATPPLGNIANMSEAESIPAPRTRRWFAFSLRTMLVVVALFSLPS